MERFSNPRTDGHAPNAFTATIEDEQAWSMERRELLANELRGEIKSLIQHGTYPFPRSQFEYYYELSKNLELQPANFLLDRYATELCAYVEQEAEWKGVRPNYRDYAAWLPGDLLPLWLNPAEFISIPDQIPDTVQPANLFRRFFQKRKPLPTIELQKWQFVDPHGSSTQDYSNAKRLMTAKLIAEHRRYSPNLPGSVASIYPHPGVVKNYVRDVMLDFLEDSYNFYAPVLIKAQRELQL